MTAGVGSSVCNMLWIGERLGPVERACARSVVRQGHRLRFWSYGAVDGLPDGVERADAAEVLPRSAIVRHHEGSVALFSNWFRYELQRRELGTWLDCDVYLVAPLETQQPYLLAEEAPGCINGAVLRLPPESPILPRVLRIFGQRSVPSWLPPRERLAGYKRLLLRGRTGLGEMRWGVAGPAALTALTHKFGLTAFTAPPEVYYPAPWRRASWIIDPSVALETWTTERTRAVHLWNEIIKPYKDSAPPPGSFLERLHKEGA